jgi:ABC-2 type transport system permease protein
MTSFAATMLLARSHGRAFRHQVEELLTQNRLMVATISGFLLLYGVAAYVLVSRGLGFIHKMPLFGPLLTERLVYLLFFFFFVMLVISNATITGMGLFRRKDMEWQVALPLPERSLVMWKTLEGMTLASWGLIVLSAPILLALGQLFHSGPLFYLMGLPALICLVTISANVSTWALLVLVRFARPWWWRVVIVLAVGLLLMAFQRFWISAPEASKGTDIVASLHDVLRHTEVCMHPLLPSSWVAETLFAASRGLHGQAEFYLLTLLANALFALVVTGRLGATMFYPAWHRVMTAAPEAQARAGQLVWFRQNDPKGKGDVWRWLLRIDRSSHALLTKDVLTFLREPTQWGQCLLIFGMLLMYSSNLRHLGYDLQNPFWTLVISHLNLLVCCLALSTLTTRFVFPQFSMEGQRLWILGLSPLPLERVMSLKLRLIAGVLALLTTLLVVMSSVSLELPLRRAVFFCGAVILQSYGLTALALSLGALLPNFREPNPARVISGFGGTLCLIGSFLYILGSAAALALPDAVAWRADLHKMPLTPGEIMKGECAALGFVAFLTIVFGGIPWWLAKKKTKNLDYLRDL